MDSQTVTQTPQAVQPLSVTNSDSQLNRTEKRLMFSAHLGPIFRKLRRGRDIEQREVLALLPFTIADGWQPESQVNEEFTADDVADPSDANWSRRLAEARVAG